MKALLGLLFLSLFKPQNLRHISTAFAELYSKLWASAEHSISHLEFSLPSAIGHDPVHRVNRYLSELYGSPYASLSFGGSSGALLTILTAVLPKLKPDRKLILFDQVCHQSAIGGIIFGRWKAVRLNRFTHPEFKTVLPLRFENVKSILETYGPEKFAAIVIVGPTYDGFSSPSEEKQIYDYAKSHGICVIIDGAWDAVRFRTKDQTKHTLNSTCDIWITSPHKRGLTPSSLGAVLTQNQTIARLWDEALDLGFRSSSVSFVEIMIAEHRLEQIQSGKWDRAFIQAEETAKHLRKKIQNVHRSLHVIEANDLNAETGDPAHILISTHKIPNLDARMWAKTLSIHFGLDVEKATQSTLLLICASPAHANQLDKVTLILKDALTMTLNQESLETC